jgi:hypothetical protein
MDFVNPYATVGSGIGTTEAASLRARLMAWHDAMVAHERRLRSGRMADVCDDECPHGEARSLWADALAILGPGAYELAFLRSRALNASASSNRFIASAETSQSANTVHRSIATRTASVPRRSESFVDSPDSLRMATAEL